MAEFRSKYLGLRFQVDGVTYKFRNGKFHTLDEKIIKVLEGLSDVKRVDEPVKEKEKPTKIELGEEVSKKQPSRKKKKGE